MKTETNLMGDEITLRLTKSEALAILNALGWQQQGITDRNKGLGKCEAVEELIKTSKNLEAGLNDALY